MARFNNSKPHDDVLAVTSVPASGQSQASNQPAAWGSPNLRHDNGNDNTAPTVLPSTPGASDANAADEVTMADAASAARRTLEGQVQSIGQAYGESWEQAKVERLANEVQGGGRTLRQIEADVSSRIGGGGHASNASSDSGSAAATNVTPSADDTLRQQLRTIGQAYGESWDEAKIDRLAAEVRAGGRTLSDIDRDVSRRIGAGDHASAEANSNTSAAPATSGASARETLEGQLRTIGQAYGESWDAGKVQRLADEVQGGGRSLRDIDRDVSVRIGGGGHQSRNNTDNNSQAAPDQQGRTGGGAGSERPGQPLDKQPRTASEAAAGRVTGEEYSFGGQRYVTGSDGMPTHRDAVDKPGMAHLQEKGKTELDAAAKVFGTGMSETEKQNLRNIAAQMEADKSKKAKPTTNVGGSSVRGSGDGNDALINVTSGGKNTKTSLNDIQKKYGGGFSL